MIAGRLLVATSVPVSASGVISLRWNIIVRNACVSVWVWAAFLQYNCNCNCHEEVQTTHYQDNIPGKLSEEKDVLLFLILLQRLSYNISFPPRVTGKCDIMKSSLCKTNINWVLHSNVKFTVIGEYKIYLRIRSAKEFSNWKNFKKWLNKDGDNLWQVDFNFIIFTSFNFEQGRLK